jgi:hypothetical protein
VVSGPRLRISLLSRWTFLGLNAISLFLLWLWRHWEQVVHVDDSVDPIRDLETITSELCKKDLETLDRALASEK